MVAADPALPAALQARSGLDAEVADWLRAGAGRVLHVTGGPGTGKTSWAEHLVANAGSGLVGTGARLVASHFCRPSDAPSWTARPFLHRTARAIAAADPAFETALASSVEGLGIAVFNLNMSAPNSPGALVQGFRDNTFYLNGFSAAELMSAMLLEPLRDALREDGPPWCILVDGLDEAQSGDLPGILLSPGELPPRLRLIVTSRPDRALERSAAAIGARRIELDALPDDGALARYAGERAQVDGLLRRLAPGVRPDEFLGDIVQRAGGNFLVAKCVLDALAEKDAVTRSDVQTMPDSLNEHYLALLHRRAARDPHFGETALPILGLLSVAREPLTESQLARAGGIAVTQVRHALVALRALLAPAQNADSEPSWRIFHRSFADFLNGQDGTDEFWRSAGEEHARLLRWGEGQRPWTDADGYVVRNLVAHALGTGPPADLEAAERVLDPAFAAARHAWSGNHLALLPELRACVEAAVAAQDMARMFRFGLLHAAWSDRAAFEAHPSAAVVQAALGHGGTAVDLVLSADEGLYDWEDRPRRLATFCTALGELGLANLAGPIVERLESEKDWAQVLGGLVDGLARAGRVGEALDWARRAPHATPGLWLSEAACERLAADPRGLALARAAAGSSEAFGAAITAGLGVIDLAQALELAHHTDYQRDLGGERIYVSAPMMRLRVLTAHLAVHPQASPALFDMARPLLSGAEGLVFGLPFAVRLAATDPERAIDAFELLVSVAPAALVPMVAALAIGGAGGPDVQAVLERRTDWRPRDWLASSLADAGPALALLDPTVFLAQRLRPHLEETADVLLQALELGRPEFLHSGNALGTLAGLAGTARIAALQALVEGPFANDGGANALGVGAAEGLALRSATAYIEAARDFGGFTSFNGNAAMVTAARAAARTDPSGAAAILESVPPRYINTRAEIVVAITPAIGRDRPDLLPRLAAALDQYGASAHAEELAADLARGAALARADPPRLALADAVARAVAAAREGTVGALRQSLAALEAAHPGAVWVGSGERGWPENHWDVCADALAEHDPAIALKLALNDRTGATIGRIRTFVRPWLDRAFGVSPSGSAVAAALCGLVRHRESLIGVASACAGVLELPSLARRGFREAPEIAGSATLAAAVAICCDHECDPISAAQAVEVQLGPEGLGSRPFKPVINEAVRALAAVDPFAAMTAALDIDANPGPKSPLVAVAEGAPLTEAGRILRDLDALYASGRIRNVALATDFRRALARRMARSEPAAAVGVVSAIEDQSWREWSLEEIVRIGVLQPAPPDWRFWTKVANQVRDNPKRADLFGFLLRCASRRQAAGDPPGTERLLAALALGPRRAFFDAATAVAAATVRLRPDQAPFIEDIASFLQTYLAA